MKDNKNVNGKFLLYGFLLIFLGFSLYFLSIIFSIFRLIFFYNNQTIKYINDRIIWFSGTPTTMGIIILIIYFFFLLPKLEKNKKLLTNKLKNEMITVVIMAYNEEKSIFSCVKDFKNHPLVKRVIVINNNSKDKTKQEAKRAGAIVVDEFTQGYGPCAYRALSEGAKYDDTSLTLLTEGDMTFRSSDIDKFIAYIPHADIVNGTRIAEQLRESNTQMTTFIYYGNFFVAKLLELKNVGKCSLSDVGTTYKLCRNSALRKVLPKVSSKINHEFNPQFIDIVIQNNIILIECPITFYKRVGESKGGNKNNFAAFIIGMRMIFGITLSWNLIKKKN